MKQGNTEQKVKWFAQFQRRKQKQMSLKINASELKTKVRQMK